MHDVLNSIVKLDLLIYFHSNSRLLGTTADIALHIGRKHIPLLKVAINDFMQCGILRPGEDAVGGTLWIYEPNSKMAKRIEEFFQYYNSSFHARWNVLNACMRTNL